MRVGRVTIADNSATIFSLCILIEEIGRGRVRVGGGEGYHC